MNQKFLNRVFYFIFMNELIVGSRIYVKNLIGKNIEKDFGKATVHWIGSKFNSESGKIIFQEILPPFLEISHLIVFIVFDEAHESLDDGILDSTFNQTIFIN